MTREKALEIQTSVLDYIKDFIPDRAVTPLWNIYREIKGLRPDTPCPCPCEGGKTWNPIVQTVKDTVAEALVEQEIIAVDEPSIQTVENNVAELKETVKEKKSYYKKK